MTEREELLPCPFCGEAMNSDTTPGDKLVFLDNSHHEDCILHEIDFVYPTKSELAAAWNRRALTAQPQGEPIDAVIRDICELEPADPDNEKTVSVSLDDLRLILERQYTAPQPGVKEGMLRAAEICDRFAKRGMHIEEARDCITRAATKGEGNG